MVLGLGTKPQHVANNVIVGLDFDGTVAYSAHVRVWYARKFFGVQLTERQILEETWPKELGPEKYRQMADAVNKNIEYLPLYKLAPGCKEFLTELYQQSFRFAVITSRSPKLASSKLKASSLQGQEEVTAVRFIRQHSLPISYVHQVTKPTKDQVRKVTKEYLCKKLYTRAFLDDGLYNLLPIRDTFVRPFFIRQPWNVHEPTPPSSSGIVTVSSWPEFGRWMIYLKEMHEAICYLNRWENAYFNLPKIAAFWRRNAELCSQYIERYRKEAASVGVGVRV